MIQMEMKSGGGGKQKSGVKEKGRKNNFYFQSESGCVPWRGCHRNGKEKERRGESGRARERACKGAGVQGGVRGRARERGGVRRGARERAKVRTRVCECAREHVGVQGGSAAAAGWCRVGGEGCTPLTGLSLCKHPRLSHRGHPLSPGPWRVRGWGAPRLRPPPGSPLSILVGAEQIPTGAPRVRGREGDGSGYRVLGPIVLPGQSRTLVTPRRDSSGWGGSSCLLSRFLPFLLSI